jgi:tRNA(Ile)-lysidine synthase
MGPELHAALEALERRLDGASSAPVAVAFSGGGDSLALLLAARAFAGRHGRPLVALHVDHGLQPQSAAWADAAERTAERLGASFVRLEWIGEKPQTGAPAAARVARHRLIAEAARRCGAKVVLVGHTLDDQLENALMRGAGVRVGVLHEWSPSPVWPEGRGLFLCRPLLNLRRADLRRWLGEEGLGWLDDPANHNPAHPRTRARLALAEGDEPPVALGGGLRQLAGLWRTEPWGGVVLDREPLTRAEPAQALRLLQTVAACAAGVESLSRPGRAQGVLQRICAGETFVAPLGGARIEAGAHEVVTHREPGEAERGGLRPLALEAGRAAVWDGRFEIAVERPNLMVQALRGLGARLEGADRAALAGISASARPAMPLLRKLDALTEPPRLALAGTRAHIDGYGLCCRALCEERLGAAAGLVTTEAEVGTIARMAKTRRPSYVEMGSKD